MDASEHDGKIKVCCRVRPVGKEAATPLNVRDRCVVHLQPSSAPPSSSGLAGPREGSRARSRRRRRGQWGFTFDDVLEDGCSQEEVYRKCAKGVVQSALAGVHGTIMAYGCTGAGKSHTMIGDERDMDGEQRGICARALRDVFREVSRLRKKGTTTSVHMSFLEFYNEQLFDLFLSPEMRSSRSRRRFNVFGGNGSESGVTEKRNTPVSSALNPTKDVPSGGGCSPPQQAPELAIYERPDGCTYVKGLSLLPVASEDEALRILRAGQRAREIAEHQFNHVSSRSHAILTVHLTTRAACGANGDDVDKKSGEQKTAEETRPGGPKPGRGGRGERVTISKLNLVDLAGSEKSGVISSAIAGDAAMLHREGRCINKSLAFLEQVTIALADRKREHIPFRCSKLTHFLKDSLGGNCRTLMIACVWPRPDLLQQSLATLKFAARMRCVKNAPAVSERSWSAEDELSSLRRQVDELKAQLALRDERRAGREGVGCAARTRTITKAALDDATSTRLFGELQEGWPDNCEEGRSTAAAADLVGGIGGHLEQQCRPVLLPTQDDDESSLGHGWAFAAAGNSQRGDEHGGAGDHAAVDAEAITARSGRTDGGVSGTGGEGKVKVAGGAPRCHSLPNSSSPCNDGLNTANHFGTGAAETHGGRGENPKACESHHNLGVDFQRFQRFKNEEGGLVTNARLQDAKAAVKCGRSLVNDLAGRVNKAKSRIDSARVQLHQQELEQEGADEQGVPPGGEGEGEGGGGEDEGEEANVRRVLLAQLKRRKREYRRLFALLAEAKSDLRDLQQKKQQAFLALAVEFQERRESPSTTTSTTSTTASSTSTSPRSGSSIITGPGSSFLPQLLPSTPSSVTTTTTRQEETPPLPLAVKSKNLGSRSSSSDTTSNAIIADRGGCDGKGAPPAAMAVILQ